MIKTLASLLLVSASEASCDWAVAATAANKADLTSAGAATTNACIADAADAGSLIASTTTRQDKITSYTAHGAAANFAAGAGGTLETYLVDSTDCWIYCRENFMTWMLSNVLDSTQSFCCDFRAATNSEVPTCYARKIIATNPAKVAGATEFSNHKLVTDWSKCPAGPVTVLANNMYNLAESYNFQGDSAWQHLIGRRAAETAALEKTATGESSPISSSFLICGLAASILMTVVGLRKLRNKQQADTALVGYADLDTSEE